MRRWTMLVMGLLLTTRVAALGAQRIVSVALGGGVSLPQGDLHSGANTGWHALGALVISTPMQPIGLRADVAYSQFPFNASSEATLGGSGNQTVGSLTLNASYRLPTPGSPLSPYVIAGLGAYRTDCSIGSSCTSDTGFGWNAGLGARFYFLGFRSFLEARYHATERAETDINYFPVSFGIIF